MKVLRILTADGSVFAMALERVVGHLPTRPHFPDAADVQLVDMTAAEFQAICATQESARRFGT